MPRILVINPNRSPDCTAGIAAAVAPWRLPGGPAIDVQALEDGPAAIYGWREWHAVVEPLCRRVGREPAAAYVIACGSDPGIDAVRAATDRPVFGIFRSAVAAAVARAERFGVLALVDASKQRHLAALRAMGLEARLAAEVALNVTMETLLDEHAARARLIAAARETVAAGAGTVVLGCTGMAHHRAAVEEAAGVPVIEPCQAGVALALTAVLGAGAALTLAAE
ncbi:MAG: aspartate/glutamate racemase family protein [Acidisphaera sp.]|nr:aspartate/glutamate racemase family protein [Acidisphaera sp.]